MGGLFAILAFIILAPFVIGLIGLLIKVFAGIVSASFQVGGMIIDNKDNKTESKTDYNNSTVTSKRSTSKNQYDDWKDDFWER
jgi:hypothetical protein